MPWLQDLPPADRARRTRAKPPASSSPAASLLHTTSLPPPAAPCQEEQPVHIDRLLEEVMMGLDILSDSGAAPGADPNGLRSICASSQDHLTQSKQNPSTGLLESCPGEQAAAAAASGEEPVLQQQVEEGELTDILDHFLHSFEQHMYNCSARHDKEASGSSSAYATQQPSPGRHGSAAAPRLRNTRRPRQPNCCQATAPPRDGKRLRHSWTRKATAPPEQAGGPSGRTGGKRGRKREWTRQNVFSSETKEPRVCPEQEEQLRQMPVVRLERYDALWTTAEPSREADGTETPQVRR